MKKLLAIAVFLMAFSNAFADINKPNIFGINFDEATVFLKGDNAPDFGDYSSYNLVFSFNALIGINNRFGIHTGAGLLLGFTNYVNGDDDTGFGTHYSNDIEDDAACDFAIQIPAMARFYVSNAFFFEAGATIDINLFEKYYYGVTDEWETIDEQKLLNVEIGGGLGFTLGFGLEFSLKYTHGLTNMYEHGDLSNSRLVVGIGYWFNYK